MLRSWGMIVGTLSTLVWEICSLDLCSPSNIYQLFWHCCMIIFFKLRLPLIRHVTRWDDVNADKNAICFQHAILVLFDDSIRSCWLERPRLRRVHISNVEVVGDVIEAFLAIHYCRFQSEMTERVNKLLRQSVFSHLRSDYRFGRLMHVLVLQVSTLQTLTGCVNIEDAHSMEDLVDIVATAEHFLWMPSCWWSNGSGILQV